jgi:hypothetical protein
VLSSNRATRLPAEQSMLQREAAHTSSSQGTTDRL